MGQTITEKILTRVMGRPVQVGEVIFPKPELITIHDLYVVNFAKVLGDLGVDRLHEPEKVLICTDHEVVAGSVQTAERQKEVRQIVERFGISMFFDAGRAGLGHVFPVELGYIRPGMFIEAYDVHVTNFGAVGALAIPMITEISEVLICGSVWMSVPDTVRVNLRGKLGYGISIRDVAQKLIGDLEADLIDYTVVEFGGPALTDIGLDGRFTLCNTPLELGAKSAIVEPDDLILSYLETRVSGELDSVRSDSDAKFKAVIDYDMDLSEPQVATPPLPDNVVGVSKVVGIKVDHAFIGSCASGMLEDLRDAAAILKERHIHPRVRLVITPATQEVATKAAEEGLFTTFIQAGAMVTPRAAEYARGV
jgi:3-isopropylmalate/(R)-2-methylmalate dehydratase large subunit